MASGDCRTRDRTTPGYSMATRFLVVTAIFTMSRQGCGSFFRNLADRSEKHALSEYCENLSGTLQTQGYLKVVLPAGYGPQASAVGARKDDF